MQANTKIEYNKVSWRWSFVSISLEENKTEQVYLPDYKGFV